MFVLPGRSWQQTYPPHLVLASRHQGSLKAAQGGRVRAGRHGLSCLRTKVRILVLDWRRSHSVLPSSKQELFRPPSRTNFPAVTTMAAACRYRRVQLEAASSDLSSLPSVGFSTSRICIMRSNFATHTPRFVARSRCSGPTFARLYDVQRYEHQPILLARLQIRLAQNLSIISGPLLIPGLALVKALSSPIVVMRNTV
jgi:hypothetical protein